MRKTKIETKEKHEAILDLWASGKSYNEIAAYLPDVTDKMISNVLWRARQRGDMRAVRRLHHSPLGPKFGKRYWSSDEVRQALALKRKELSYAQIGAEIGRTGKSVEAKLKFYDSAGNAIEPRPREFTITVPDSVEELRTKRLSIAPRDLTAAMFGDPLPGFSALDRRVSV